MADPDRTRRALALFKRVVDLSPAERERQLDVDCGADDRLRELVAGMLRAEEDGERPTGAGGLGDPRALLGQALGAGPSAPERIGKYTVVRHIGEGGMGVVYEARQDSPSRSVALKLPLASWLDSDRLRRFEREVEVLGRLRHPGIAQVLEGGTLELAHGAQPYVAMELVAGVDLATYVDRERPTHAERLEMVASIADAVQHAHEQGVVHRDLKPANILVEADGRPRILDFGVALLTEAAVPEEVALTRAGAIIGTLGFMSPEQAGGRGEEVDTRTDVYALGVILYYLLAGRLPLDVDGLSLDEAVRVIRNGEPAPLGSEHDRDLVTIVRKATEKEKGARYASASELAADIRRFLRHEPIAARPPSALYHLRKLAQRNRRAAVGVFLVAAMLVATALFSLRMARLERLSAEVAADAELEAKRQRDEAVAARDDAEALVSFLLRTIESVRPEEGGREVPLREVLEPMARQTARAFADKPRVEGELWRSLGASFSALGDRERGLEYSERALELLGGELEARHPLVVRVRTERALALRSLGRHAEAETELQALLPIARELVAQDFLLLTMVLDGLSLVRRDQRRLAEAEAYARECLALARQHLGEKHEGVLDPATKLAVLLSSSGRTEEARDMLEGIYADAQQVLEADHPDLLLIQTSLAQTCMTLHELDRAEELMRVALEGNRRVYGEDHPHTVTALVNLAALYQDSGRPEQAEPLLVEAVQRNSKLHGERSMNVFALRHNLAVLHSALGRREESARMLGELAEDLRGVEDLEWLRGVVLSKLGASLMRVERIDESLDALHEAYEILVEVYGEGHTRTDIAVVNLVDLYEKLEDQQSASEWRARLGGG